jgi:hypothetical protein
MKRIVLQILQNNSFFVKSIESFRISKTLVYIELNSYHMIFKESILFYLIGGSYGENQI